MTSSYNPFTMLFAALGMLALVGGALAAAAWQHVVQQSRLEAVRQWELRKFHAGLLDRVESLAEKSGMLTSADLCPVRFRFRMGVPAVPLSEAYSVSADLTGPGAADSPVYCHIRNGTIEFGLMPSGSYQLRVSAPESYVLEHDFEVLQGVPVDRVVLCPDRSPPGSAIGVEIVWPEGVLADDVICVCDIERDTVTLRDWTWRPTEDGCVRVVAGEDLDLISEKNFDWIAEEAARDGIAIVEGASYRNCCVRAISIYAVPSGSASAPVRIARCVFDDELHAGDSLSGEQSSAGPSWPTVGCRDSPPTYAWSGGGTDVTWRITTPDELVSFLLHRDHDSAADGTHEPVVCPGE